VKKLSILLVGIIALGALATVACGGGGDDDDDGTPGANTTRTVTSRTATRASGTPGSETASAGTPAAGETAGATSGTPAAGVTTAAGGGSPAPGSTPAAGTTPGATDGVIPGGAPTPTDAERSSLEGVSEEDLEGAYGGNPNDPPTVITDLPPQPAGATTDPTTIADPQPDAGGVEIIIDLNASEPGIQSTREVNVGDIVRVGVVVANAPAYVNGEGGLAAFNFFMRYDRTKIIAPTIVGGSSAARNPDLNDPGLGANSNWACVPPAPEGDADDPGSATGDGDPTTGEAFISCYWALGTTYASGDLVLATVTFQAVGSGTTVLDFEDAAVVDALAFAFGTCGDSTEANVPCRSATLTVR
jgi:hypothetical protein